MLKKIAVGGMAEIFLARTEGVDGPVVIKRILPQLAEEREFIAMFLDEAKIAASLSHPNIVQVVDSGQAGGDFFIAMEYLHGEDLRKLMLEPPIVSRGFPLDAAVSIVLGMTAGLHHAHEAIGSDGTPLELVHRDVTPQNVFVTFDGTVKLMDFGIAKAENRLHATKSGMLKGKVQYMSPEQGRSGPLDRRSDLYSIGIILYELTTGYRLYKGGSEFEILKKIVEGTVPPPSRLVPGYPLELEKVVMKALQKDPARRHQTAAELAGELGDVAQELRLDFGPEAARRLMHELYAERIQALEQMRATGSSDLDALVDDAGSAEYTLPPELRPPSLPDAGADTGDAPPPAVIDGLLAELDELGPPGPAAPPEGRPLADALRGAAADAAPRAVLPSPRGSRLPMPSSSADSTPIPPRPVSAGGELDNLLADLESSRVEPLPKKPTTDRAETFSDFARPQEHEEESLTGVTRPVRPRALTTEIADSDIEATETTAATPRPSTAAGMIGANDEPTTPGKLIIVPGSNGRTEDSVSASVTVPADPENLPGAPTQLMPPLAQMPRPPAPKTPPQAAAPATGTPKVPAATPPAGAPTTPERAKMLPAQTTFGGAAAPSTPGRGTKETRAALATPTAIDPPARDPHPSVDTEQPTYEKLLTPPPQTPTARTGAPPARAVSLGPPLPLVVRKSGLGALWAVAVVLALGALALVLELKTDVFHPARRRAKIEAAVRAEDEAKRTAAAAQKAVGDVVVESEPDGAAVWLRLGRTPLDTRPLDSSMIHELRLEHDAFQVQDVVVAPPSWSGEGDARRAVVAATLVPVAPGYVAPASPTAPTTPAPAPTASGRGVIHIESTPPGAAVWLLVGFTNETRITSHPTDRDVELKIAKDGFVPGFALVRPDDWRDPSTGMPRVQVSSKVTLTPLAAPAPTPAPGTPTPAPPKKSKAGSKRKSP